MADDQEREQGVKVSSDESYFNIKIHVLMFWSYRVSEFYQSCLLGDGYAYRADLLYIKLIQITWCHGNAKFPQ